MSDQPYRLKDYLIADFKAMGEAKPRLLRMLGFLIIRPRWLAVVLHRLAAHFSGKAGWRKIFQRLFWLLNWFLNGCDISPHARIGPGLKLIHPCGVVIGWATIGSNATILQNVTIGLANFRDMDAGIPFTHADFPVIGNDVSIFAGAVLLGAITVGDGAQIGANAVVLKDVPPNCMAVGVPARVIMPKSAEPVAAPAVAPVAIHA
jgi:serine O-acetyltransferase